MKYLFLTLISISSIALAPKPTRGGFTDNAASLKCELKLEIQNPVGSIKF